MTKKPEKATHQSVIGYGVFSLKIEDVKTNFEIPPRFLYCYECRKPAVYIEVSTTKGKYGSTKYPEEESNNFAEALRNEFKTNLELPVCEEHCGKEIVN